MGFGWKEALRRLSAALAFFLLALPAGAQGDLPQRRAGDESATAALARSAGDEAPIAALTGRNIARIEVVFDAPLWSSAVSLQGVRVGQTFTPEIARRALDELGDSGRFAELRAEVEPLGAGVLLRLRVVARRVIAALRTTGLEGDADELLRAASLRVGAEISARELPALGVRLEKELARRGFPDARVRVSAFETDDPMGMVLVFDVEPGSPARVVTRRFFVWPDPRAKGMGAALASYAVSRGDRADLDALEAAARELEKRLQTAGYFEARVEQGLTRVSDGVRLDVKVYAGSRVERRFEGNRRYDATELEAALELEEAADRSPQALSERLRAFYEERGLLDATIDAELRGKAGDPVRELVFRVREGEPVRVVSREYPCLRGERDPADVGSEIDSFLSELPGGTLVDVADPASVDALFGPKHGAGARPSAYSPNPWSTYSRDVYESAREHLEDLFRSEGYLSAAVGPVVPIRRRCDARSAPGQCIVKAPRARPPFTCRYDAVGVPVEEELPDVDYACREDPARGVHCEPEMTLSIPIKLGPRSFIERVAFDGNRAVAAAALLEAAELEVGAPVSQAEIDRARRRVLDAYAEEGYAFAEIEAELELSEDRRRAVVRFVVSERKPVRVSRIVIRGARITSESLIRRRIALRPGELYRRSLVRRTEEHLATLGVFSSVTVGFEDPYVPAAEKVVVVALQERKPQYLDVRPGFSTGEGFRITFEYGHRNLGGEAIQLTLRSQLGFLPTALILEDDVRAQYAELGVVERLERRNTATVEFPDIGLGPLFRLSVEGVDARDNARDFGLTKDAAIVTLFFLPERRLSFQLGGSLERNDAEIFDDEALRRTQGRAVIRVPDGPSFVVSERVGVTWDRRDNPLDATSGTFVSAGVEHVQVWPLGDRPDAACDAGDFEAVRAEFMRYTNRVAGYLRLSKSGLALAASFRWGINTQLFSCSRTYPDRLFFMGGVDSLRGFLQDSLIPEDVADRVRGGVVRVEDVPIRGGNMFVNPRLELRIPLGETVQTALFLDTGNLWTGFCSWRRGADGQALPDDWHNCFDLRYATGTGIRVGTPIGPLVFDYGFNVDRVLDALDLREQRQPRYWEDLGAFHFGIGLF